MILLKPLSKPVDATVSVPGSKSYTNRALIMAALTEGMVTLVNSLFSDDTQAMIDCLKVLGLKIKSEENKLIIENDIADVKNQEYHLNARLSGTTIRFILALSCIVPGVKKITGEPSLNSRPISDLVEALRQLGAKITYDEDERFPPITVHSSVLKSAPMDLRGEVSSQFFSALMMIAPKINGLTINVSGSQISKSYIDMTIDMMKSWGVFVENKNYQQYTIAPNQKYSMKNYVVEGDYSAAGYFFAIAALTNSKITVANLNPHSQQGDRHFLEILKKMGAEIIFGKNEVTVIGHTLKPVEVNMEQCPDQAQTLSVLASFADGKSVLHGVRSLRVKETERVKAVQTELAKMGIRTDSPDEDTLIIYGGQPKPAMIDTYNDHRMAMSFAVAGAKLPGMQINNPEVVSKTFPDFWEKLEIIGMYNKYI